jgi:hypothetical protein
VATGQLKIPRFNLVSKKEKFMALTKDQWDAKLALMHTAATMASGTCPPGTAEAAYNTEHARCYQYLLMRAMPDETVYTSPAVIAPAAIAPAAAATIPQATILAALTKALSDPTQAANLAATVTKLIAAAVPAAAPAAVAAAALATAVSALPSVAPVAAPAAA